MLLTVGGVIGYHAFQGASALTAQGPSLIAPDALQHIQFPKFLRPWDSQVRTVLQNWLESHAKDISRCHIHNYETDSSVRQCGVSIDRFGSGVELYVVAKCRIVCRKIPASATRTYRAIARSFLHGMNTAS